MIYANTHVTSRHDLAGLFSRRIANSQRTTIIKGSSSVCHRLAVQVQHDVLPCRDLGLAGDISQQRDGLAALRRLDGVREGRIFSSIADPGDFLPLRQGSRR